MENMGKQEKIRKERSIKIVTQLLVHHAVSFLLLTCHSTKF